MIDWKKVRSHNFPIMSDCYVSIDDKALYAHIHSACMKKGVFFNIVCEYTGKTTAKKVQAEYYCLKEDFKQSIKVL